MGSCLNCPDKCDNHFSLSSKDFSACNFTSFSSFENSAGVAVIRSVYVTLAFFIKLDSCVCSVFIVHVFKNAKTLTP